MGMARKEERMMHVIEFQKLIEYGTSIKQTHELLIKFIYRRNAGIFINMQLA